MTNELELSKISRRFYLCIPLYFLIVAAFWIWFEQGAGYKPSVSALLIGAAGWMAALILRGPVAVIGHRLLSEHRAKILLLSISGLFEEGIRVLLILSFAAPLPWALSFGLGWAAIEILFTVLNGFIQTVILRRNDKQSKQLLMAMERQGINVNISPLIGVVERIFASAFHIGASLLAAYEPLLILALMPMHSSLNLAAMLTLKRSMAWAQTIVAAVGGLAFIWGWYVSHMPNH